MSIIQAFAQSADRNSSKIAVACGDASWTYSEFDEITTRLAGNLLRVGAEPGDRVALHLQNGLELALSYIGCLKAGCVLVPLNTRLKGREVDYVLRHSGSAFYIGEPELYSAIEASCPALTGIERFLLGGRTDRERDFHDLLRFQPVSLAAIDCSALAAILYTSGSTAHPKGVMHSHATLHETALAMRRMMLDEDQTVLVMSSMSHMVGFALLFLSGLDNGATVVLTRPLDFGGALDAYARWRCTYTLTLPVLLRGLLETQLSAPRSVRSGRYFFAGGDSVSPALQEAFEGPFEPICEAYGSTEIAPVIWNRPGEQRVGAMGKPGESIEVRLLNGDGRNTAPGEIGELWVQAPHRMIGYWQDPDATNAALRGSWFRTGDLARCDADGYLWFAGRQKEIIVRGGSNISPQEVEAAFYQHPAVAEAGVVGLSDQAWGEVIVAHVALRPGHCAEESELLEFVRERLADYKVPERVIFHSELPRAASGKLQRRFLRALSTSTVG